MTRLEIRHPDGSTEEVDLEGRDRWTIGSGSKADYRIELSGVHPVQLGVVRRSNGYLAVASKQAKVFKLNGKLVDRRLLQPGDTIQLGPLQIVFEPRPAMAEDHPAPLEPLEADSDTQPLPAESLPPLTSADTSESLDTTPLGTPTPLDLIESPEPLEPLDAPLDPLAASPDGVPISSTDPLADLASLEAAPLEDTAAEAGSLEATAAPPAATGKPPGGRSWPAWLPRVLSDAAVAILIAGLVAALLLVPRSTTDVSSIDDALARGAWLTVSQQAEAYLRREPSGPLAEEMRARAALARWSESERAARLPQLVQQVESAMHGSGQASFWEPAVRRPLSEQLEHWLRRAVDEAQQAARGRQYDEARELVEAGRGLVRLSRELSPSPQATPPSIAAQRLTLESVAWQLEQRTQLDRAVASIESSVKQQDLAAAVAAWLGLARGNPELAERQAVRRPIEQLAAALQAQWIVQRPSPNKSSLAKLPTVSLRHERVTENSRRTARRAVRGVVPIGLGRSGIVAALRADGRLAWAFRVGAFPDGPAWASLSGGATALRQVDPAAVRIIDGEGKERWGLALKQPPLPLVRRGTLLVISEPHGRVHVYDVEQARLTGVVNLPLPLDQPATVDPVTGHLLVAARAGFVFEFDPQRRVCVGWRFTGHLPGTLRTPAMRLGTHVAWVEQTAGGTCRVRGWPAGSNSPPATLATIAVGDPQVQTTRRGDAWWLVGSSRVARLSVSDDRSDRLVVHHEPIPVWCCADGAVAAMVSRELWLLGRDVVRVRGNDLRRSFTFHPFINQSGRRFLAATSLGSLVIVGSRSADMIVVQGMDDGGRIDWTATLAPPSPTKD